jgi:hypothetical protein
MKVEKKLFNVFNVKEKQKFVEQISKYCRELRGKLLLERNIEFPSGFPCQFLLEI